MPLIDRRTLIAGTLASAALPSSGRSQNFPVPQGFERFPIWPGGKAPGGDAVTVKEVETLRTPQSAQDDTACARTIASAVSDILGYSRTSRDITR